MIALVCDDELLSLGNIKSIVQNNEHITEVNAFSNSSKALAFVNENQIDIAFLDIEMGQVSGFDIAKAIRAKTQNAYIVFTSGYDYAIAAFEIKANGYLLKPYDAESVNNEINIAFNKFVNAQVDQLTTFGDSNQANKRIRFKTIPSFDMFVDGKIVSIPSAKSKEFLALLVDRKGSSLTLDQVVNILWEDKDEMSGKALFRVVFQRLNNVLKEKDIEDLIVHSKNQYSLNTNIVSCDYYDILRGDKRAMEQFVGEYMNEYSWAEDTVSILFRITDPNSQNNS